MIRRAAGRGRKGIQRGIQKSLRRLKEIQVKDITKNAKLSEFASKAFEFTCLLCCFCFLVPMSVVNGKLEKASSRRQIYHYIVLLILSIGVFHKTFRTLEYLLLHPIGNAASIMSSTILTFSLFYAGTADVNIFSTDKTIDLINSWPSTLGLSGDARGRECNGFESPWLCVKVIPSAVFPYLLGTAASVLFTVVYPDLSCSIVTEVSSVLNWNGLLINLACAPLEFAVTFGASMCVMFPTLVLLKGINVLRRQLEAIRYLPLETYRNRMVIQRLYNCGEIYNGYLNSWHSLFVAPGLLTTSALMTLCLYVSIRLTEMPIYLYLIFPYTMFQIAGAVLVMSWDTLVVLNTSNYLSGLLHDAAASHLARVDACERIYAIKRARANRPHYFGIRSFAQFSLTVPITMGEEIINQLVFLLTF